MTSERTKAMDDLKERLQSKERCFWVGGEQPASPDSIFGEALAGIKDLEAELAKLKALADTLAGALEPVERLEMWSDKAADNDVIILTVGTIRKMREALTSYKEARDAS